MTSAKFVVEIDDVESSLASLARLEKNLKLTPSRQIHLTWMFRDGNWKDQNLLSCQIIDHTMKHVSGREISADIFLLPSCKDSGDGCYSLQFEEILRNISSSCNVTKITVGKTPSRLVTSHMRCLSTNDASMLATIVSECPSIRSVVLQNIVLVPNVMGLLSRELLSEKSSLDELHFRDVVIEELPLYQRDENGNWLCPLKHPRRLATDDLAAALSHNQSLKEFTLKLILTPNSEIILSQIVTSLVGHPKLRSLTMNGLLEQEGSQALAKLLSIPSSPLRRLEIGSHKHTSPENVRRFGHLMKVSAVSCLESLTIRWRNTANSASLTRFFLFEVLCELTSLQTLRLPNNLFPITTNNRRSLLYYVIPEDLPLKVRNNLKCLDLYRKEDLTVGRWIPKQDYDVFDEQFGLQRVLSVFPNLEDLGEEYERRVLQTKWVGAKFGHRLDHNRVVSPILARMMMEEESLLPLSLWPNVMAKATTEDPYLQSNMARQANAMHELLSSPVFLEGLCAERR